MYTAQLNTMSLQTVKCLYLTHVLMNNIVIYASIYLCVMLFSCNTSVHANVNRFFTPLQIKKYKTQTSTNKTQPKVKTQQQR